MSYQKVLSISFKHLEKLYWFYYRKGLWHKNEARHTHFHFKLKIAGIPSDLQLEKCSGNKKSAKSKNNLGHFLNLGSILNGFRNIPPNAIFTVKVRTPVGNFVPLSLKIAHWSPNFTVKIAFGEIFRKPFKIKPKFKKWPNFFFNFALFLFSEHFSSCKTDRMPAVLSSNWKWAWRAWFLCHNPLL